MQKFVFHPTSMIQTNSLSPERPLLGEKRVLRVAARMVGDDVGFALRRCR